MPETTEANLKWKFLLHNVRYLFSRASTTRASHLPLGPHDIGEDFFAICVASSPNPACDDYVIGCLKELGIQQVRVDLSYDCTRDHTQRLLRRLIHEEFRVCLHLVQPIEEARAMLETRARERWSLFLSEVLAEFGDSIELLEIGTTVNRRNWCGYNLQRFLSTWRIAHAEALKRNITIAGPNVTDFEPVYNLGLLGILHQLDLPPNIHTTNLFAERATEPEAFDHKILGAALAPWIKYNTVKKAQLLRNIASANGISRTFSTHAAWSLRRIDRLLADLEEKQADYLARYGCLCAVSGGLARMYWGPLVGQRAGLVDNQTSVYPELPRVTLYADVPGEPGRFRKRPALDTFSTLVKFLSSSRYLRSPSSSSGLEIHEFSGKRGLIHVIWTRNGRCAPSNLCYSESLRNAATAHSRDGHELSGCPAFFHESPTYLVWPSDTTVELQTRAGILPCVVMHSALAAAPHPYHNGEWRGIVSGGTSGASSLTPETLESAKEKLVMRNRRNKVWAMPDPRDPRRTIVVKRIQVRRLHRRLIQKWHQGRAERSWNGTNELLRRGIATPRPVAYFQQNADLCARSYFVYEEFDASHSVRHAFQAFTSGANAFEGLPARRFYACLSRFLLNMHQRGVYFRDLSAGNILCKCREGTDPEFCLIDTTRARFYLHPLNMRLRLRDLRRILHPLNWTGRNEFLAEYMSGLSLDLRWWMKVPIQAYDIKHRVKWITIGKRRAIRRAAQRAAKEQNEKLAQEPPT